MTFEVWRQIPAYSGRYEASDHGRIRSMISGRGPRKEPLILEQSVSKDGYAEVNIVKDDGRKSKARVNRLVCAAFTGIMESSDMHASHINGDKLNNTADNLEWATKSENELMKRVHGRVPAKKLTEDDVRKVHRLKREEKMTNVAIGKIIGCSDRMVGKIIRGVSWPHIKEEFDELDGNI